MPEIGAILREGKGKKVYATDDPDKEIVYFKDDDTGRAGEDLIRPGLVL